MYKEMILKAREDGLGTEKVMFSSIDDVDNLLEKIKSDHEDLYWDFIRSTHVSIYGEHYNKEFADYDLSRLEYKDADGNTHEGAYWTCDDAVNAFVGKEFDDCVTKWDKWVALNVFKADLCKKFTDEEIIEAAYLFWFADEDYCCEGKIWHYMNN